MTVSESKVSVSVEEQIAAVLNGEQFNYVTHSEAILETLLLAQSTIAERDAEIAEMRKELATERDVIEEMRVRAYRVRCDVNLAIFEIEQMALTDKKRTTELTAKESSNAD